MLVPARQLTTCVVNCLSLTCDMNNERFVFLSTVLTAIDVGTIQQSKFVFLSLLFVRHIWVIRWPFNTISIEVREGVAARARARDSTAEHKIVKTISMRSHRAQQLVVGIAIDWVKEWFSDTMQETFPQSSHRNWLTNIVKSRRRREWVNYKICKLTDRLRSLRARWANDSALFEAHRPRMTMRMCAIDIDYMESLTRANHLRSRAYLERFNGWVENHLTNLAGLWNEVIPILCDRHSC